MTVELQIKHIRRDGGTQPRAGLNEDKVQEYVEAKQEGAEFPAVTVFFDGTDHWLTDGFHRIEADLRLGRETVVAEMFMGTQRDAILHSVGANATHGLPRSREDKQRAVLILLNDEEWGQWSDREIARRCGVSPSTVGSIRSNSSVQIGQIERKVQRNGATYTQDTTNIGKSSVSSIASRIAAPEPPAPESEPEEPPLFVGAGVLTRTGHFGFVRHINGAFHQVETINGIKPHYREHLLYIDLADQSMINKLAPDQLADMRKITAREMEQWNAGEAVAEPQSESEPTENPFKVGDRVRFKGGWRKPGPIRYIKGTKCGVYNEQSHSTHYYDWTELLPEDEYEYKVGDKVFIQANRAAMNYKNDHIGMIRELLQDSAIVWTAADDGRWENVNVSYRWMRLALESELSLEMPEPEDIPVEFEAPETFDASEQFETADNLAINDPEAAAGWVSAEADDHDEQLRKAVDALNRVVEYERGNLGQGQLSTDDYDLAIEWLQAVRADFDSETSYSEMILKNEVETWG